MEMFNSTLKSEDVKFFYRVLYQYEKEGTGRHTGYSYKDVPLKIRKKVSLVHDTRKSKIELKFPVKPNTILYKGIGVSSPLLKHIRHSFAHACIERDGEYYIINSQVNSKCQICGKVKRTDLMDLVNGILSTKKKIIKNREMRNFTFKGLFLAGLFMVLGCLSIQAADDLITKQITIKLDEAGTLPDKIGSTKKYQITNLKIIGEINGTDLMFIRNMAGGIDFYDETGQGKLSVLDLSQARIVVGGGPYFYYRHHEGLSGGVRELYVDENDVLGDYMFSGCSALTSLILPSSVTKIGNYAFEHLVTLTSLIIPSNVTEIGNYAFVNCRGLTSMKIPSSVTNIGDCAFLNCSGLISLVISSGVIDGSAFENCSGLTSLIISSGVTKIGSSAFKNCSGLTSLVIPSGVTEIGWFAFENCSGLTSIYVYAEHIYTSGLVAFKGCDKNNCKVYVPKGTYDYYIKYSDFRYFKNIEEFDATGIDNVITPFHAKEVSRYSINGQRLSAPTKGLNIVKYSDGSVKKVAVQ